MGKVYIEICVPFVDIETLIDEFQKRTKGVDLSHQFTSVEQPRRASIAQVPGIRMYIISCGASKPGVSARFDTARRLDEVGVPYQIVVEPGETEIKTIELVLHCSLDHSPESSDAISAGRPSASTADW